jgi:dGTPase
MQSVTNYAAPLRPVAPYAVDARHSAGRLVDEPACPMRTPFQRDRDRIVHATAFRRLNYKTQVFVFHEGDHYRSRLTHSLEVAQIARSMARLLGLDEDLAEALALAHDLGHPPFGHAGERALDRAMADFGGFDHNAQSLRVVTRLERKYARFDGLNLSLETLDGLIKHNGPVTGPQAHRDNPVLTAAIAEAGLRDRLDLDLYASAEAQAAAIADDIAWLNHDIDDGLRAGLLAVDDLAGAPYAAQFVARDTRASGPVEPRRAFYEINRRMITAMIAAAVEETRARIGADNAASSDAVRRAGRTTVAFPQGMATEIAGLSRFLFERVYHHPRIAAVMNGAETIVAELFARYWKDPDALPDARAAALQGLGADARARRIGDFIAGMTDRFAIAEHRRLFDATPELS